MALASWNELGLVIIRGLELRPPPLWGLEIASESGLISLATNTTLMKISLP